jgi:Zinc knuckle
VKEFPGYEAAKSTRNVIKLWQYIRKSHLTHMYGASDNMRAVNVNDQKMKFNNMRQGDREYVSDFKTRYDNQLKANEGVGIVADDESLVAIDFLSKLDPKRFTSMLTVLRNNAAINVSSYPTTLAGAYRTASTWTSDGLTPFSIEHHSALVVEKGQGKAKPPKPPGERTKKTSSSESIECFVCGNFGHYARDCPDRKSKDSTLVVHGEDIDEDAYSNDGYDKEAAYVLSLETALFARHILLLDTQSSANVVAAAELLTKIRRTSDGIILSGIIQRFRWHQSGYGGTAW